MAEFELTGGSITATVSDLGGELTSLLCPDQNGEMADVIRRGIPYAGAICGRFANRIAGAQFTLDGTDYVLATNDGSNHIHGGLEGFDLKVWDASPYENSERLGVRLTLVSAAGDQGYPGNLTVEADYWLDAKDTLGIDLEAAADAATIVNLTNHAYWNLGGAENPDIRDHHLQLGARHYLEIDQGLIPTGRIVDVTGTDFDLTVSRPLLGSFDHCFVLNDGAAAVLTHPNSGRTMRVLTNQPGLQVYTANHANHFGVALETQGFPDAPNHSSFPSAVLRPGEIYRRMTRHQFAVMGPRN
jgi:aldose 1-epimerase